MIGGRLELARGGANQAVLRTLKVDVATPVGVAALGVIVAVVGPPALGPQQRGGRDQGRHRQHVGQLDARTRAGIRAYQVMVPQADPMPGLPQAVGVAAQADVAPHQALQRVEHVLELDPRSTSAVHMGKKLSHQYSPSFSLGKNFVMRYSVIVFNMGSTPYLLIIFITS